jgi:hypothetical protein
MQGTANCAIRMPTRQNKTIAVSTVLGEIHMRPTYLFRFVTLFVFAICLALCVHAQNAVTTGSITGVVRDSNGHLLANARILALDKGTGKQQVTTTNDSGTYNFPVVDVGTYDVSISAAGFKTSEVRGVAVGIGHTTDVGAALAIGEVSQTVEVNGSEASTLNPTDTTVGTLVEESTLDNLPLSGRRYTDLVLLTPNVTTDGEFGHITFAGQPGGQLSGYQNSASSASNGNGSSSFTVDGVDSTSYYLGDSRGNTRLPYLFGLQSIQEFQVQTAVYNASYGGAGAGFINTVTKSGTNAWHGDAFYYNRNSGTGANDAVDKAAGNPRTVNILQQFGADTGGPIVANKMFFYFDYEQQSHKDPMYATNAAQAATNEASFGVPSGTALPTPNASYPAAASISENTVNADPTNAIYLQGVSNALNSIHSNLGLRARRRDEFELFPKYDWQLSPSDHITADYNYVHFNSAGGFITYTPENFAGDQALANAGVRDHVGTIHWTHTMGNSLVNDAYASYVRDEQIHTPSGLAPSPTTPEIEIVPPSFFMIGNADFAYSNQREYQWQLADHVTYSHSKNQVDLGYNMNHVSMSTVDPGTFYGQYLFLSLQDYALGKWDIYSQSTGNPKYNWSSPYFGFYANDTWRVTPKLTLTGGLREDFEVYPNPLGNPALPFTQIFHNQYLRISPRFGFSYAPSAKTVIRGGGGLYHELLNGAIYQNSTQTNGVTETTLQLFDFSSSTVAANQSPSFPAALASTNSNFAGGGNIVTIGSNTKVPSIFNSSVQIDQQIAQRSIVTVGSIWTHAEHLFSSSAYDLNQEPPTGTTTYSFTDGHPSVVLPNLNNLQEGLISPNFGQINALISPGISNYNSLFGQFNRQVGHGASVIVSYTFSKSTERRVDFWNQFDLDEAHGLSLLDQRQRLSAAAVYAPSVSLDNRMATELLKNWKMTLLSQFNSGRPYTGAIQGVNDSAANQNTENTSSGLVGQNSPGFGEVPGQGLNTYHGPWLNEIDLGLERGFNITEKQLITLKAQVFNALNSPNYYVESGQGINQQQYLTNCNTAADQTCTLSPNNGPGGFQTLNAISQLNQPRIMQFSFTYRF